MTKSAPGKWSREGISLVELGEMFPDEEGRDQVVYRSKMAEWPVLP